MKRGKAEDGRLGRDARRAQLGAGSLQVQAHSLGRARLPALSARRFQDGAEVHPTTPANPTAPTPRPPLSCRRSSGQSLPFWVPVEGAPVQIGDSPSGTASCGLSAAPVVSMGCSPSSASNILGRPGRSAHCSGHRGAKFMPIQPHLAPSPAFIFLTCGVFFWPFCFS